MEIREIKIKEVWENFLSECQEKTFLQSWNWGEFNKEMGNKIWRFGIYEQPTSGVDYLVGAAFLVKVSARRGTFLSLPHGPAIKSQISNIKSEILKSLLEKIKELAKQERAIFLRLSPFWERNEENIGIFKKNGFLQAPILLHPDLTWELNLLSSEEELFSRMRKTTRYLIRQARNNKEIEIIQSRDIKDIEVFNKIYQETVNRQIFVPYSLDYLKKEFLCFEPDNQIVVFLGKYKQEIVSSAIVLFCSKGAFYHHGATLLKYPKIPVSYLLQWEAIKEAKRRGCKSYNFWGIAPEDSPNHPWQGFTLFKKGFGGEKKEYVKTQDLPFSKRYWLVYLFEKARKAKRGL